jgi:hypothetical protein
VNAETGNLKLARKLLGHSNLSTTADIYTRTSAEAEHHAAVAVKRAIYGNLFPIVPKNWGQQQPNGHHVRKELKNGSTRNQQESRLRGLRSAAIGCGGWI